jgi:hypothetical protein
MLERGCGESEGEIEREREIYTQRDTERGKRQIKR